MIYVRGYHKIIFAGEQLQQVEIGLAGLHIIAVEIDMTAPPCPIGQRVEEGIEATGIHVGDAVGVAEVSEIRIESLTRIGKACSGRQPRARTYHNGIALTDGLGERQRSLISGHLDASYQGSIMPRT